MLPFEWQKEVKDWVSSRRIISNLSDEFITFFQKSFENTRHPHRTWFGTTRQSLSLIIGGIYLSAYCSSGSDAGIWLMVDERPEPMDGLDYRTVKSSAKSDTPLWWVHAWPPDGIKAILTCNELWTSFGRASDRILAYRRASADRDHMHRKKGKKRLDSFFQSNPKQEVQMSAEEYASRLAEEVRKSSTISRTERLLRLEGAPRKPQAMQIYQTAYQRNPDVIAEVLERANGFCEACGSPAPFIKAADGKPYLEVHHKVPLSQGGEDTVCSTVALCPNCHRKAHYGQSSQP